MGTLDRLYREALRNEAATLYHYTSPESASSIRDTGFQGKYGPHSYFTDQQSDPSVTDVYGGEEIAVDFPDEYFDRDLSAFDSKSPYSVKPQDLDQEGQGTWYGVPHADIDPSWIRR